jgi:hypothetical protein
MRSVSAGGTVSAVSCDANGYATLSTATLSCNAVCDAVPTLPVVVVVAVEISCLSCAAVHGVVVDVPPVVSRSRHCTRRIFLSFLSDDDGDGGDADARSPVEVLTPETRTLTSTRSTSEAGSRYGVKEHAPHGRLKC